jgi:nucleotide-binding universal stress UspA family protein
MYDKILVPLDGSEVAQVALQHAMHMAEVFHASLILLRVAPAPIYPESSQTEAQRIVGEDSQKYLVQLAKPLQSQGYNVSTVVSYGKAAEEIITHAAQQHVSIIVMATHGWSGVGHWPLGSTAIQVLRGTTTPILLIRATQKAEIMQRTPGGDPLP